MQFPISNFQFPNKSKQTGFIQHYFFDEKNSAGFTVIELIVVLAIMAMIVGLVIIDFAGQRPGRDLRIAQNELVTNIRKAQSYSLFSRNVNSVKPAQYYVLKFSVSTPDRYYLQAITDASSAPALNEVETILLPKNIIISVGSLPLITRPTPTIPSPDPSTCALLAFKAPFAKVYANNGCNITSPPFQNGDDYKKILGHINNINGLTVSSEANLVITLAYKNGGQTKKVLVKGITGLVCPSVDGQTCAFSAPDVTQSQTVSENNTAALTCSSGTIKSFTSKYGSNCAESCPVNCGTCTIGAVSCSVTYNNTNCGDCHFGCVKNGDLTIVCGY